MNPERHVKIFKNGRNQAIRIPREFEFSGEEAIMRKEGDRLIIPIAGPSTVVARSGGSTPHRLAIRKHCWAVSSHSAVVCIALVFQLERAGIDLRRHLRIRRSRHQSRLSPLADASRVGLPEMAGIQLRRSWRLLYAGHARALGGSASASS